ncbi:cdc42 effector protein 2 [Denticeps clupeoides]|uniref:cdc42 effector protein 2 n=1 Tax=Denticeps clupeoides TaxID=299321 RepID=UPI0010A48215|nr:cdc42 effector protein 2-like [Denticeps clupeoides]
MPAKTPMYLKTATPKRGKKVKLRDVLSGDMISPPLGDLRHSAHVGPDGEGDMFGDIGFLQGKLDMLPALSRSPHPRSQSVERRLDEAFASEAHNCYNNKHGHHHTTLLKSTISMPIFLAPEQPPPKPPRLHLDDAVPLLHQHQDSYHQQQNLQNNHHHQQLQQQQRAMSVCEEGVSQYGDPRFSASIPALCHLVPSSGSLSDASSEDSMLEGCVPLEPQRGLSLDSDAGLSNEDLHSEHSESPAISPSVSRSESLLGLDLDLGPSILDDVLGIMDRYKSVDEECIF